MSPSSRYSAAKSASGRVLAVLATAGIAIGSAACSTPTSPPTPEQSQDQAAPSPAPTPSEEEEDTDTSTTSPADNNDSTETEAIGEGWTTDPSEMEMNSDQNPGGIATDFRAASHEGYDRVVLELTGEGPVGWWTHWSDAAVQDSRGEPIDLAGTAFLNVIVRGTATPSDENEIGLYYSGDPSAAAGSIESFFDGTFEGSTNLVIGMDQKRPYRIFTLQDPLRVVIDVQN